LLAIAIASSRENGATRIFLEVAADNQAALALYCQAGFHVIGTRPGYYHHGDQVVDAVMMELDTGL
jgi:ribosomal-protein-alanine N-acetyltransferase